MYSVGDIFYEISIKTFEVQAYFIIRTPYNNITEITVGITCSYMLINAVFYAMQEVCDAYSV